MKQSRTQYIAILLFLTLLFACTPAPVQGLPTQANTAVVHATSTIESNSIPTQLVTSIPTEISCPEVNPDMQFSLPTESNEYEASILKYLNEAGDPTKLEILTTGSETQPFFALSADMDGDLLPEVITGTGDFYGDPAIIHLYHCEQNSYQLAKSFTLDGISFGIPEVVTRIFDSEPSFMIIRAGHIHGWAQDFLAIGWHNSEWQMINLGTGLTPAEIALLDQNADGTKEIFIKTKTAATPGGGISRVLIESYFWDGTNFVSSSSALPPGNNRVHYLADAETAWQSGNPLLAVSYYEIAARDSTLPSYGTSYEIMHEQTDLAQPYQQAFSFFRIVAIWFYLDRPEVAAESIQEMSEVFPSGKPGHEFVLAAQAFSNWYEKDPDFSRSCAQAVNLLDTQYPDMIRNHLGDWGVANPMYFATSDVCTLQ